MSFLSKIFAEKAGPKVFVLSLDGVPYTHLRRAFDEKLMPALRALAEGGRFARMTSVIPTVSSVAWASYMTGANPGRHGIYGFVERQPSSYDVFVPTSLNLKRAPLWEAMGEAGRKVIVVNVPMTYPCRPVNGIVVADFLCTNMDKLAQPPEISTWLKGFGYRIDADAKLARTSLPDFVADVNLTLDKRFGAAFHLMKAYPWDFFHLHVMETDRINHFLWPAGGDDPNLPAFNDFYRRLDGFVGDLAGRLPDKVLFILLSDHGFCPLKREVYLNQYLAERGLLALPAGQGLPQLLPETRAYSLIPGRIYLNLRGREPRGSVSPADYTKVREEVTASLRALTDPADGARVIRRVAPGEELFRARDLGRFPAGMSGGAAYPPDLVAVPEDGYDLKGNVGKGIFGRTELTGMHTYDDAFLLVRGRGAPLEGSLNIADVLPSVLDRMGVPLPEDLDGRIIGF